jgi:hypothetical protein
MFKIKIKNRLGVDFDVDFNILTAFKDRIGLAPKGRGALHNYKYRLCAVHIIT